MLNIAVLVSGGGTNLQALINAQKSGVLKSGKINLVISSKADVYALTRCENSGIESLVISKKDFNDSSDYDYALLDALAQSDTDIIVLAGFMTILSPAVIKKYANRIINVHPALIPSFCGKGFYGMHVHEAALEYGVKITGATVHFVNEIVDGGKIIAQKAIDILDDDTPSSLQKRVMEQCEWVLLPEATEKVCKSFLHCK